MDLNQDKNAASQLGDLFQHVVHDMKRMMPMWEEFIMKTNKLSISLRATVVSLSSFLDALQKIADIATGARGATKDIGSGLTRLCLRHRNIENKLKIYSSGLVDAIVLPIQERLEEWKKSLMLLDKDHAKDHKKMKQELRKMSTEAIALQNKVRKGKPEAQAPLNDMLDDLKNKTYVFEEFEKSAVRSALVEERTRFCVFISCLKPVMDMEISVLSELTHIQEVVDSLCMQAGDPNGLPAASEQVILDIQEMKTDWFCQSSPMLSKHCSFQSINSIQSSPTNNASHLQVSSEDIAQKTSSQTSPFAASLSLISDDSGFVQGQDFGSFTFSRPEKWMPVRQRSWTGLTQFHSGRDAVKTAAPLTQVNSVKVPGRKKCPDINMVDDLPFRSSAHTHSLPPTPNPYAIPCLLNRIDGNSLSLKNFKGKSISKGSQPQRMTGPVDVDALRTGVWASESYASFEDDESYNSLMQELQQTSSSVDAVGDADCDAAGATDGNMDVDELAAAMQELEWTTAMLDSLNNPCYGSKCDDTREQNWENEESHVSNNDCDSAVSKNLSKPPISGILRRSSMQGARKPPPPVRRTSSVTGSPQANLQATSVCSLDGRPTQLNNQTSLSNITASECSTMSRSPRCVVTSSSSGWSPGKDDRQGNGRRIPKINRTVSQSFGKNTSEDERLQMPAKEKSRLPRRSLSDTHAEIIQTLNEQFSFQPTNTSSNPSSERHPVQLALGNVMSKPLLPSKFGTAKSPDAMCQIPEGVTISKGVAVSSGSPHKNTLVRLNKKCS